TRFSRDWSSDVCSSDLITINTDNAARHHHAPRRGIDHKTIVIFDVFFPVSDAHFVVDKRISGIIVWHPNQGFCQTHEQDTFLGRSEERRVGKESRSGWW